MALALPRPPRWWSFAALGIWAACTVATAAIPDDTFFLRLSREVVQVAGTLAAAVAVGGSLVSVWQYRQWRRRTQWLTYEHVSWASRNLTWLAADIVDLAYGNLEFDEQYGVFFPQDLVELPVNERQREAMAFEVAEMRKRLTPQALASTQDGEHQSSAAQQIATRVRAATAGIQPRADAIWDAVVQLSDYTDDQASEKLLTSALWLRRNAADLFDPMPGVKVPDKPMSFFAVLRMPEALHHCGLLAEALSLPYADLQARASAPDLIKRLADDRLDRAELDDRLTSDKVAYVDQVKSRAAFDQWMSEWGREYGHA